MVVLSGCTPESPNEPPNGPPSTQTDSSEFATVAERVAFLDQYVSFRRTYETLDFDIAYHNNRAGVPGPSDWDVRLVATVPASDLNDWVPDGVVPADTADAAWLRAVPTALDTSGLDEWYVDGGRTIGLDRHRRIVAYRIATS